MDRQWPDLPRPVYYRKGTPNPAVLGRRHCIKCGRWRPIHDFPWRRFEQRLDTRCSTCRRVRWRIYNDETGRSSYDRRIAPDATYVEGAASNSEVVPAGPFLEWLAKWRAEQDRNRYDDWSHSRPTATTIDLAELAGVSERVYRRAAQSGRISIPVVDRTLIAAGGDVMLSHLYPEH